MKRGVAVLIDRVHVGSKIDDAPGSLERQRIVFTVGLGGDVRRSLIPLAAVANSKRAQPTGGNDGGHQCRRAVRRQ